MARVLHYLKEDVMHMRRSDKLNHCQEDITMKKRKWFVTFVSLMLAIGCWNAIPADAPGQAISATSFPNMEAYTFTSDEIPSLFQQQGREPASSFASFDHQTVCTDSGWKWNGSGDMMWCESYVPCGNPAPACPGVHGNWNSVVDSSRICQSVKTYGYRVYCHVESSE
jgi:hypothetical protein